MRQRRRFSHPARWLWLAAVLLLCVTAVGSVLTVYLGNLAREDLQRQNEAAVAAVSLHIEAELQGLNRAVKALAENPSILRPLCCPIRKSSPTSTGSWIGTTRPWHLPWPISWTKPA